MLRKAVQYVRGYLRIRIAGYGTERFLNACRHRGIKLWDMEPCGDSYEMSITISGFRRIKPIVRKTGTRAVIVSRIGLPFFLYGYRKRKLFFVGAVLCLLFVFALSRFIWSIDIRGNLARTDETLLEFLKSRDVKNGMRIADINCGQIVKDIRKEYNDIIWVSASVEGTRLIVQIKENQDAIQAGSSEEEGAGDPMDIVADRDCIITEMITRKGVPLVKEGAQVKEGDILVSGQVPVNNDAGETVSYHYQESDADITGQASISYLDSQSLFYEGKKPYDIKKREYYVRVADFRFCFAGIRNEYEHFEQYSRETQVKLFDNFYIPVYFGSRWAIPYEPEEKTYKQEEYQSLLSRRFFQYCEDLEKKGVEIIENDVKIYTGKESAEAKGTLTVAMPVGARRPSALAGTTAGGTEGQTGEENGNDGSGD